jgi:hypothetical protein
MLAAVVRGFGPIPGRRFALPTIDHLLLRRRGRPSWGLASATATVSVTCWPANDPGAGTALGRDGDGKSARPTFPAQGRRPIAGQPSTTPLRLRSLGPGRHPLFLPPTDTITDASRPARVTAHPRPYAFGDHRCSQTRRPTASPSPYHPQIPGGTT